MVFENFVSLFCIPVWTHFLLNNDSSQSFNNLMELETQNTILILINWSLQWFEEGLFGLVRKKLLLIDLINFDQFSSEHPKISIRNVSCSLRIIYLPLLLDFLKLELVYHGLLFSFDLTVSIDDNGQ